MALIKLKELQNKTEKELADLVNEQRQKLRQLSVDSRTKKVTNVKEFSHFKKNIARVLTLQRQKQLEGENDG